MGNHGTSKIVLLTGVYLIIGLYSLAFNRTDESVNRVTIAEALTNQTEQIAMAGIRMGLTESLPVIGGSTFSTRTANVFQGQVSYRGDVPSTLGATESRITSTGTLNGHSVTVVAIINLYHGHWKVTRTFTQPTAQEFALLHN
jgi:hypothetical protein